MEDIIYLKSFVQNPDEIYNILEKEVIWDNRMASRKTASFGKAYNYSEINYPFQKMLPILDDISLEINKTLGFLPNNCLINYYKDGNSKMGFHSDQVDILEPDTGIAIVSVGSERVLRFRKIADKDKVIDYELNNGSLLYMTQAIQKYWKHAIPTSKSVYGRMSLTFRKIKED